MTIEPIVLPRRTWVLSTLEDAKDYIEKQISNKRRSEPLWCKAIYDIRTALVDSDYAATARTSVYEALKSDGLVD